MWYRVAAVRMNEWLVTESPFDLNVRSRVESVSPDLLPKGGFEKGVLLKIVCCASVVDVVRTRLATLLCVLDCCFRVSNRGRKRMPIGVGGLEKRATCEIYEREMMILGWIGCRSSSLATPIDCLTQQNSLLNIQTFSPNKKIINPREAAREGDGQMKCL